jgi:hypothetical protein
VREIFRHQRVTDILAVHREHPAGAARARRHQHDPRVISPLDRLKSIKTPLNSVGGDFEHVGRLVNLNSRATMALFTVF